MSGKGLGQTSYTSVLGTNTGGQQSGEKLPEFLDSLKVKLVPVVLATVVITTAYWVPVLPTESYLLYYYNNLPSEHMIIPFHR